MLTLPRYACTYRFFGSSRQPEPAPSSAPTARYLPSPLIDNAFGYYAVGIYPVTLMSLVLMTATAFSPPHAAYKTPPSAERSSAVGANPRVSLPESVRV